MSSIVFSIFLILLVSDKYKSDFLPFSPSSTLSKSLTDWLWQETESMRLNAVNSTFINRIQRITLDPVQFGIFDIQDIAYCNDVSTSFREALKKQSNGSLYNFLEYEMNLYKGIAESKLKTWKIKSVAAIDVGPEFRKYNDHHLNVSRDEDPIYTVLSSIPCEKLWPWIGNEIKVKENQYGPYDSWIKDTFDPSYDGFHKLEDFVNAAFKEGRLDKNKAFQIYSASMESEVEVFNSVRE